MKKQKPLPRGAGILLPISSLPDRYGIGTLGAVAYRFADFLSAANQSYWQMLPLGPTGYGDSPYQSFSAFAGNPYFVDLETLREANLLSQKELDELPVSSDSAAVDYSALYHHRLPLLRKAAARFLPRTSFADFCRSEDWWLSDYALFMALKTHFQNAPWTSWPMDIRLREEAALARYHKMLSAEMNFWRIVQYWFFSQWNKFRQYAAEQGVLLIGDMPIYVSPDSADVWVHRAQYLMDEDALPQVVAGVPPDCFSQTGQLWGNPIYDWVAMEQDDFSWWKRRMNHTANLFDFVRLDHFLGYVQYYAIPGKDNTAEHGQWCPGPGEKLLDALESAAGSCRFIAEDLGIPVPAVQRLLQKRGYPNMKVLQFAFDSDADNPFLPHRYPTNCVVYGGTHDNDTQKGFFQKAPRKAARFARDYLGVRCTAHIPSAILRAGYASVADVCIFQMQDILELGSQARMNLPSSLGGNWQWRLLPGQCTEKTAAGLRRLTELYSRLPLSTKKREMDVQAAEAEKISADKERSPRHAYL